jgi:hypothetical protein
MAGGTSERVVVTVDDARRSIESIADSLRSEGMKVDPGGIAAAIGIITGEVEHSRIPALRSVSGVTAVEPETPMRAL